MKKITSFKTAERYAVITVVMQATLTTIGAIALYVNGILWLPAICFTIALQATQVIYYLEKYCDKCQVTYENGAYETLFGYVLLSIIIKMGVIVGLFKVIIYLQGDLCISIIITILIVLAFVALGMYIAEAKLFHEPKIEQ